MASVLDIGCRGDVAWDVFHDRGLLRLRELRPKFLATESVLLVIVEIPKLLEASVYKRNRKRIILMILLTSFFLYFFRCCYGCVDDVFFPC